VVPRAVDRLHLCAGVLRRMGARLARNVVIAIAVVYGLGWRLGASPLVVVLVTLGLGALLAWEGRQLWWLGGELWQRELADLPRRRRAIAGPGTGTWATDIVADRGRYAVLLLHFAEPGGSSPPPAHGVPDAPWGPGAGVPGAGKRTIVAFEWAGDRAAADAAAQRLIPR